MRESPEALASGTKLHKRGVKWKLLNPNEMQIQTLKVSSLKFIMIMHEIWGESWIIPQTGEIKFVNAKIIC